MQLSINNRVFPWAKEWVKLVEIRPTYIWLVFFTLLAAGGCEKEHKWKLTHVEGTVTQAGRPVVGVQVVFWPDVHVGANGPRAFGFTNGNGRYELQTDSGGHGATAGKYRVGLLNRDEEHQDDAGAKAGGQDSPQDESLKQWQATLKAKAAEAISVPENYKKFDKTPLRAEVQESGAQKINFELP